MNYREINDYELIDYIREDNEEANKILFDKYKPLMEQNARRLLKYCKYSGLELNDLVQEGMLALNQALKTFNESKETIFFTYARTCIERRQISAVLSSQRNKHKALNEAIPYELYNEENGIEKSSSILLDNSYNPESIVFDSENGNELISKIKKTLTIFEDQVFDLKVAGFNYSEIAEILNKEKKAIDNAIQRIRNKIKDCVDSQ